MLRLLHGRGDTTILRKPNGMNQESTSPATDPIRLLSEQLEKFAKDRDWEQFHSPKNLASALIVEAGELLEHFQWITEADSRTLDARKKDAVAAEAADVLLYLIRFASVMDIDLVAAAQAKLQVNAKRYPIELARGTSRRSEEL